MLYQRIKNKLATLPSLSQLKKKTAINLLILLNKTSQPRLTQHSQATNYTKGIYYIAFEKKYVDEAIHSARSIKKNSRLPLAICCDRIEDTSPFDIVRIINPRHVRAKVDYLRETPFDYTLYLDSDTEVLEDITECFQLLEKYDVCMTHDFARKRERWSNLIPEYKDVPDGFSEFGGGVILYKKNAYSFLSLWKHYFYKYFDATKGWDQASLRIAAWHCTNTIYVLPPEFNVRGQHTREKTSNLHLTEGGTQPIRQRILHWHGLNDPSCTIEPYKF